MFGGSFLGNILNTGFSALNQSISNHFQRDLTKWVNTNKHQWEVSDLRKAGLNPILSANSTGFANAGMAAAGASDLGLGASENASNTALKLGKESNRIQEKGVDNNKLLIDSNIDKNTTDIENSKVSTAAQVNYIGEQAAAVKAGVERDNAVAAANIEAIRENWLSNRINAQANANSAYHAGRMTDSNILHNEWKNKHLGSQTDFTRTQNRVYGNQNSPYNDDEYGKYFGYVDYGMDKISDVKDLVKPFTGKTPKKYSPHSAFGFGQLGGVFK